MCVCNFAGEYTTLPLSLVRPYGSFNFTCPEAAHFVGGIEEVGEVAFGIDAAIFEDDDVVGASEGGSTVGDDEGGGV